MTIYIQAIAAISPQQTFGPPPFLTEPVEYTGNRLSCIEPDYSTLIDTKSIRRMSRIIRMGVAAASACLQDAGIKSPDAIVTGTAYGCLMDTGLFLTKLIEQEEEMLPPTAFIQSTHNTVGGQIALLLQCHCYNNTFVHRGFSFESALLDARMLLQEEEASHVLAGSVDEITDISHTLLTRLGQYKRLPVSNLDLFASLSKGTIAGEGAAFFLLTSRASKNNYAQLDAITTFYKPKDSKTIEDRIASFLQAQQIVLSDIDLVIIGRNGDLTGDAIYNELESTVFNHCRLVPYKHLCGEYPTSLSFALWLGANIIKTGMVPPTVGRENIKDLRPAQAAGYPVTIRRILIYNHYLSIHHSLVYLSAVKP
ncbi:beta-ketoacyl synthase chain length factor [Flavitalea flava]